MSQPTEINHPSGPPQGGPPPEALMFQMITGKWVSAIIGAVARFAIADHVATGPKAIAELARLTKTNEQALYRLLRASASLGVLTESPEGTFGQTPTSAVLRSDAKPSLRHLSMMLLDALGQLEVAYTLSRKIRDPRTLTIDVWHTKSSDAMTAESRAHYPER